MKQRAISIIACLLAILGLPHNSSAFVLSGHVKYIADDPDGWDWHNVRAIGSDLNPFKGELRIPYQFSRGTDQYTVVCIGTGAFQQQPITYLSLPPSCRTVKEKAFMYCSDMLTLKLNDGLKFIENSAFNGCRGLTSLILPPSIKFIGREAFAQCQGLKEITVGKDIETIEFGAFARCSSLSKIIFSGHRLSQIPEECFYDDGKLETVELPVGVRTICRRAFYYCESLRVISWDSNMQSIGPEAFGQCNLLEQISTAATIPPSLSPDAFTSTTYAKAVLIVPPGTTAAYRSAPGWNKFTNIQERNHN